MKAVRETKEKKFLKKKQKTNRTRTERKVAKITRRKIKIDDKIRRFFLPEFELQVSP